MNLFIKDYYVDYLAGPKEGAVLCNFVLSFSFRDDIDIYSEHMYTLNTHVGTTKGIERYLNICLKKKYINKIGFFNNLIVTEEYDEIKTYEFIKRQLENITGKSKKEILYKAMVNFELDDDYYRGDNFYDFLCDK